MMRHSVSGFDAAKLSTLSSEETVDLFKSLLWCAARDHSVPLDSITISTRVDTADGGIDADIRPNAVTPAQDLLVSGNSHFQLKAGTSAAPWQKAWIRGELFASDDPGKAALGPAVRHCLGRRGRYILVCFGCDPTGEQRRKAIKNLREAFTSCGYKNPRVDVWGQSTIAGLIHGFCSLVLRLTDRHDLPFLTASEWCMQATMQKALHLREPQQAVVEEIKECIRGEKIRHVRLIGEPGVGKTRLALEALGTDDLKPTVVYVENPEDIQRGALLNAVLRGNHGGPVTLVVDDCSSKECASIWNAIKHRQHVNLITLDHGPEHSTDESMRVIQCPALDQDGIKAILDEYVGGSSDASRWADFCGGSPRVAHAVGENLRRNPDDILKSPAEVPIWERFVGGGTKSESYERAQTATVLRHIALFHKFGFAAPVDSEARFIAGLLQDADNSITWARFQSIIKDLRDRRILQGKTTLFLVPRALHVYLWRQFWDHYGSGTDTAGLLSRMPASLFRWFCEMFKYGHASSICLSQIERLTDIGGPFDDFGFITDGPGAPFLNELAEAHPEAALRCIERTVGSRPPPELGAFTKNRQYIVWALEKIAVWRPLFRRAAAMLFKLAYAENGRNSNNATGTFCGLFSMGFGRFASSEAPPEERLQVILEGLTAPDRGARSIALKAAAKALAQHPHSKMVGPEHQGTRPLPKLWTPKIWGDVFAAYRGAWQMVTQFRRSASDDDRVNATKVLIDAAYHLLQNRWIEDDVIAFLTELCADPMVDLRELVRLIAHFRSMNWQGISRKAASGLRRLDQNIGGTSVASQIRRLVLLGTWDDVDRGGTGTYGKKHTATLRRLAASTAAAPEVLDDVLPDLMMRPGFVLDRFGFELGSNDVTFRLWPRLLEMFKRSGGGRNPEVMSGYLRAMFLHNRELWEGTATLILRDEILRPYADRLVAASGLTEAILDQLCESIDLGQLPSATLMRLTYLGRAHLSEERFLEMVKWCASKDDDLVLLAVGLSAAYFRFCRATEPSPLPEQPVLDLLTVPNMLRASRSHDHDYEWNELTKRYVADYPQHARRLFETVIDAFNDFDLMLAVKHSGAQVAILDCVRHDPRGTWPALAERLCIEGPHALTLSRWLRSDRLGGHGVGPLGLFEPNDVLDWIAVEPKVRAPLIASACAQSLSPSNGGVLAREILVRYGHDDSICGALWANFGTETYMGRRSEHCRKKRDVLRLWLAVEKATPVIRWLERYIDDLGTEINNAEIREEREF